MRVYACVTGCVFVLVSVVVCECYYVTVQSLISSQLPVRIKSLPLTVAHIAEAAAAETLSETLAVLVTMTDAAVLAAVFAVCAEAAVRAHAAVHAEAAVCAEAEQAQGAEGVGEEDTLMGDELAEDEGGEEVCVCYVWLVCECDCVCKCVCCCSCTCVLVYTHTHICLWARL
jgi:hypothetical protein